MKSDYLIRTEPARSNKSSGNRLLTGFAAIAIVAQLVLACAAREVQKQSNADVPAPVNSVATTDADKTSGFPKDPPLQILSDVPLSGGTTRLDYQSLDSSSSRLYIAHLGSDLLTVFDVNKQTFVGDVKDLRHVHGVLSVPELHRVYASATGTNELAVIDDQNLTIVARVPAGEYPDGLCCEGKQRLLHYLQSEHPAVSAFAQNFHWRI